MSYFILLLFLVVIAACVYKIFDKDFLSPTVISCVAFSIAVLSAIIGLLSWNFDKNLSILTFFIFVVGICAFFLGELLCRKFCFKAEKKQDSKKAKREIKNIPLFILILILLFVIITTVLLVLEIIRVCKDFGFTSNSFKEILAFYRTKSGLFSSEAYTSKIKVNFIVKQMQKACNVINMIMAIYFIDKIFTIKSVKKSTVLELAVIILILIISLLQTILFNGGRSIMFHFLVGYIGLFAFEYFYAYNKKFSKKFIYSSVATCFVLVLVYYIMLPIVGRSTQHNFIEYNTFSFGTSISTLDLYIKNDNSRSENLGEETFSGVYYTLNKFGIIEYTKPQTHEWYSYANGGTLSSNVFTSFRAYYKDFGLCGVGILQFIFGFAISWLYMKVRKDENQLLKIIYFYFFYIFVEQIRDEQFFSLLNISTVANMILMVGIYYIILFIQERRLKYEKN